MANKIKVIANIKRNGLDAQDRIRKAFNTSTHHVLFAPVCAFGIVYNCYLETKENNAATATWNNQIAEIRYKG